MTRRDVLRRTVLVAGSVPVLGALLVTLGLWATAFTLAADRAPTYTSTSIVAFSPRDPVATGAETMVLVTPKYVALLDSSPLVDRAAAQLARTPASVRTGSTATIEPNTLNLRIESQAGDPASAAATADALAAGVVRGAADDPLVSAELVAPATPAASPTAPTAGQTRVLGLGLGAVVGLLTGCVLARGPGSRNPAPAGVPESG